MDRNSATIPNYIRASSLIGLRRSMLLNNARLGAFVSYFDIQLVTQNKKSEWIAWYYDPGPASDVSIIKDGD